MGFAQGLDCIYRGKNLLAQADPATEAVSYYHTNYLGAVHQLTNAGGTMVWEATYLPFGEAVVAAGSTVTNNWRLPGQYFDRESGLYYNYHRYYDPGIGRYLTPDPIGLEGGINLYAYVSNNPVNLIDPLGLKEFITVTGAGTYNIGVVSFEGGDIAAIDAQTKQIYLFNYAGGGPGLGISKGVTFEVGSLVTDNIMSITKLGAAVSVIGAAGLKGFSGQYAGNLKINENATGLAFGYAMGYGGGISGLITWTRFDGIVSIEDLPDDMREIVEEILEGLYGKDECQ